MGLEEKTTHCSRTCEIEGWVIILNQIDLFNLLFLSHICALVLLLSSQECKIGIQNGGDMSNMQKISCF